MTSHIPFLSDTPTQVHIHGVLDLLGAVGRASFRRLQFDSALIPTPLPALECLGDPRTDFTAATTRIDADAAWLRLFAPTTDLRRDTPLRRRGDAGRVRLSLRFSLTRYFRK
jgi:hypothetical protein